MFKAVPSSGKKNKGIPTHTNKESRSTQDSRISMNSCLFSAMVFRLFPLSSIILETKKDTINHCNLTIQPRAYHSVMKKYRKPSCICTFKRRSVKIKWKPDTEKDKPLSLYLLDSF